MKYWLLIVVIILLPQHAMSAENRGEERERIEPKGFLYGMGLGINQEIYKGYDYRVIPLPIVGYRSENFRVLGPCISYDVIDFSDIEVVLHAAPRFQGFDDSDSYIFKNLTEIKFSMDARLGL